MDFLSAKQFIIRKLQTELPSNLPYHGIHHTLAVYDDARQLAVSEKISSYDQYLLLTAALFHDSGFIHTYQNHEQAGCEIARQALPSYGYTPAEIQQICEMIMATKIPQSPTSHLARILCDADLYYLGTSKFYDVGQTLYQEFLDRGIVNNEQEWNRIQLNFLQSHTYFTQTAKEILSPQKARYLSEIKKLVSGYAA
ncbi:MAG: HD domain-containing protein [Bacteroidota bacterium]